MASIPGPAWYRLWLCAPVEGAAAAEVGQVPPDVGRLWGCICCGGGVGSKARVPSLDFLADLLWRAQGPAISLIQILLFIPTSTQGLGVP